jgi:hypothetical protein
MFDRIPATSHNGLVRRLMLLAAGLSALLWTAAARPGAAPPDDIIAVSGAGSCLVSGDSHDPGDSDRQWRDQHHPVSSVTESVWKSAPVHAALGATRSPHSFETAPSPSSPDPPARSALPYLRHTPLLI